jgi:serine/threonine-protein kinase
LALMQSNNPAGGAKLPKTLFGYEVVDRIGEGAASTIYAVTEPKTHQLFALKHVVRKAEKDIRYVDQVENEFNVSKLFRHPGLRRSVELKVSRRAVFGAVTEAALVMEYVHGLPINEHRPEGVPAIIDTFVQTGRALEALHHLRLVHCDLKPNNIIRDNEGRVKVIDFGQTCPFGTEKPRLQGTPDYMAPEQVKLKPVSPRTDVYNFGATMYWTLTGERAPTLYTIPKGQKEILKEQKFPTPVELRRDVPEEISKLVMDCLRYRPHERPTHMEDVLRVLEGYRPG